VRLSWLGVDTLHMPGSRKTYFGETAAAALTPVQREAMDWLGLMLSGQATVEDVAAMEKWRQVSPAHTEALALASKLNKLADLHERTDADNYVTPFYNRPLTRRLFGSGVAVALAGYAVAKPPLGMWPSFAEMSADYRTTTGERRTVALSQGMSVELNTRSSIALRPRSDGAAFELIAGEIAVTAKPDNLRKITAFVGNGAVRTATGSFDLRKLGDGFRATCLDGPIEVSSAGARLLQLSSGQSVEQTNGNLATTPVNPAVITAWRRGQLLFFNTPLRDIVDEINRYRHGRIVIVNSALGDRRLNGSFWIAHLDNVAAHLDRLAGAAATVLPGGVILLS
jgi:transmembrane sensor